MSTGELVSTDASSCAPALIACDTALVRVFGILGKRWNGLIIATLTAGPTTFSNLVRGVGGISDSMLSERLTGLAREGLVIRSVDAGPPVAVTYELSPAGSALLPALDELARWANVHLPDASVPPC